MISLRLPPETENLIHLLSKLTGIPKNTLITQAVNDFIERQKIGNIPLKEKIKEPEQISELFQYEQMMSKEQGKKLYENLEFLFDDKKIWTKNTNAPGVSSGKITPGYYGRNTILGYTSNTSFDDINIISKVHDPNDNYFGPAIRYRYEITSLDDWLTYMRAVQTNN